ncbi:hypothetical protein X781_1930 [Mannheimia sp. USDA-ARS-USMARC-1261]|nr:hypothetical protein X781_1930 [Mannheimia sp. USDA-ARS-USMARC-1261]
MIALTFLRIGWLFFERLEDWFFFIKSQYIDLSYNTKY